MKSSQPPAEATLAVPNPVESQDLVRLRKFTGTYYRALGWFGAIFTIGSIATVYWTNHLYIDLTFVMWFWLGGGLKNGSSAARKLAIATFMIASAIVVLGFLFPGMKAHVGLHEFERSHPVSLAIGGLIVLVFAVPGILLLGKRGRAAFRNKDW